AGGESGLVQEHVAESRVVHQVALEDLEDDELVEAGGAARDGQVDHGRSALSELHQNAVLAGGAERIVPTDAARCFSPWDTAGRGRHWSYRRARATAKRCPPASSTAARAEEEGPPRSVRRRRAALPRQAGRRCDPSSATLPLGKAQLFAVG